MIVWQRGEGTWFDDVVIQMGRVEMHDVHAWLEGTGHGSPCKWERSKPWRGKKNKE